MDCNLDFSNSTGTLANLKFKNLIWLLNFLRFIGGGSIVWFLSFHENYVKSVDLIK